ncbi:MAG: hypothetical protein MUF54_05385 [Polyangiaceae bacterium]|jgi:hypothetical protein|nr:hypothetical protein [Polyangiaceae bacterium]
MSTPRGYSWSFRRTAILGACLAGIASTTAVAEAATWLGKRTTPRLAEIVAVDATGEAGWPFGLEDIAGDLVTFESPEQSMDIRTAYAGTDAGLFWVRAYVSDARAVGADVTVFVFIDSDANSLTGGKAGARADGKPDGKDIHELFVSDPSDGGYEYVMAFRGNGTVTGFWEWRGSEGRFAAMSVPVANAAAETGVDTDPILINGAEHGYLQGNVNLDEVGLARACAANLFLRSVNDAAGQSGDDLDVGRLAPCLHADANADGVPDLIVPSEGCSTDATCPGAGVCIDGRCVLPRTCLDSADCGPGFDCTNDGRCVPQPGPTGCTSSSTCDGLVCVGGKCVACTPGGTECGEGWRCGPDGRCYQGVPTGTGGTGGGGPGTGGYGGGGGPGTGGYGAVEEEEVLVLEPGEQVQGGACVCTTGAGGGWPMGIWLLAVVGGLWRARSRSRRGQEGGGA